MSDVLSVVTLALFAYAMITPALQSFSYGEIKMELQVPIWWFWAAALIGIAGAILCAIGALIAPRRAPPRRRAGVMAPSTIGAIGVLALFTMLFFRVPVWIALTLVGFVGNSIMSGVTPTFALAGTVPFDVGSGYTLSVLPLFILMGEVASVTGLSSDLFKAARVVLAGVRGGLAVGALAASRLLRRGLRLVGGDRGDHDAHRAAGNAQGRLRRRPRRRRARRRRQPRHSHSALDHPGDLRRDCRTVGAAAVRRRADSRPAAHRALHGRGGRASPTSRRTTRRPAKASSMRERLAAMKGPWQFLALFLVTIGGIYAGVFSPTEAASVGAAGAIVLGVAGRRLTLVRVAALDRKHGRDLRHVVRDRVRRQSVLVLHGADAACPTCWPTARTR